MIGNGLTFGLGVCLIGSIVAAFAWLGGAVEPRELMAIVAKTSIVAFLLGVAFSGALAVTARGRRFSELTVRLVGSLGAVAGLLYFAFLAFNGGRNWSARDAIANLLILPVMGAASAVATLLIARRAGSAVKSGEEVHRLSEAENDFVHRRGRSRVDVSNL
jgi:hypothetical protein